MMRGTLSVALLSCGNGRLGGKVLVMAGEMIALNATRRCSQVPGRSNGEATSCLLADHAGLDWSRHQ